MLSRLRKMKSLASKNGMRITASKFYVSLCTKTKCGLRLERTEAGGLIATQVGAKAMIYRRADHSCDAPKCDKDMRHMRYD
jgi:hypothetical protein